MQSKLPHVGTTIFTTMSAMAQTHGAINLSQGYPDFSPPQALLDLQTQFLNQGKNQYPPMTGIPELREQIALKVADLYQARVDMDTEITITSGATEGLFVAIQAVVRPGDEVIVFDPAYDAYDPAITLAQGKTIHIPMDDEFKIDWQRVKAAVTKNTRAIMINSPHNPSGSILTGADLDALEAIIAQQEIYVISDEVYEHMVFDGEAHLSVLSRPAIYERAFVISSFGKTYHATGWKVGYCVAPPLLSTEFRKIHQFVVFTTHTPTQWALAAYMKLAPAHCQELVGFYQDKRDLFLDAMKDSAFSMRQSQGTYFQLADYHQISDLPDVEFAQYLTREVGVAAIPISVFYQQPVTSRTVRFCFAKDDKTLQAACAKLSAIPARATGS